MPRGEPKGTIHLTVRMERGQYWIAKVQRGEVPSVPIRDITRKLDADFFHGRRAKATDRQRELLQVVSILPNADQEFTVQEVVAASQNSLLRKPFTSSHVSQMLSTLAEVGLVYKNRHGKYSLAVPLLDNSSSVKLQAI